MKDGTGVCDVHLHTNCLALTWALWSLILQVQFTSDSIHIMVIFRENEDRNKDSSFLLITKRSTCKFGTGLEVTEKELVFMPWEFLKIYFGMA